MDHKGSGVHGGGVGERHVVGYNAQRRRGMGTLLKLLGGVVGLVFLIGLLVVIGLLMLIF